MIKKFLKSLQFLRMNYNNWAINIFLLQNVAIEMRVTNTTKTARY